MASYSDIIAGARIRAVAGSGQEALVRDVFTILARIARQDPPRPGLSLRFGWTRFILETEGDGFMLCEPDFGGDPHKANRPSIEQSLIVIAGQAIFARSHDVTPLEIAFDDEIVVARGALDLPAIQAFREPPDGAGDSGWTVCGKDAEASDDADDYEMIESWQLLARRPELLSMLILPADHGVILEPGIAAMVVTPP